MTSHLTSLQSAGAVMSLVIARIFFFVFISWLVFKEIDYAQERIPQKKSPIKMLRLTLAAALGLTLCSVSSDVTYYGMSLQDATRNWMILAYGVLSAVVGTFLALDRDRSET